jgi:hypothetical protein
VQLVTRQRRIWVALVAGLNLLVLDGAGRAEADATSYSGVVLSVDQAAGTIVVGDMGPVLKSGRSEIARRSIQVKPSTAFVRVKRAPSVAPSGWHGDYVATDLAAADVKPGQWVTVAVEGGTQRLTAVKVTVVDTSEP